MCFFFFFGSALLVASLISSADFIMSILPLGLKQPVTEKEPKGGSGVSYLNLRERVGLLEGPCFDHNSSKSTNFRASDISWKRSRRAVRGSQVLPAKFVDFEEL